MRNNVIVIAALLLFAAYALPQALSKEIQDSSGFYSTCPDFEHSVVRSVAYVEASKSELIKWAINKPKPEMTARPETVRVRVQVEGERVFCAQALNGPPEKQKDAVGAAMKWRFKKDRGDFKSCVIGQLEFRF